jgi:predicted nuclease of predicted toxin-antitoxin system
MTIHHFKLLTDENIDAEVVEFLRQQGFDVLDIKENKWFSLPDISILELSYKENRIIVSQDSDFGTLVFRDTMPFVGIIYLRPGHTSANTHIQSFKAILSASLEITLPFILVAEHHQTQVKLRLRVL